MCFDVVKVDFFDANADKCSLSSFYNMLKLTQFVNFIISNNISAPAGVNCFDPNAFLITNSPFSPANVLFLPNSTANMLINCFNIMDYFPRYYEFTIFWMNYYKFISSIIWLYNFLFSCLDMVSKHFESLLLEIEKNSNKHFLYYSYVVYYDCLLLNIVCDFVNVKLFNWTVEMLMVWISGYSPNWPLASIVSLKTIGVLVYSMSFFMISYRGCYYWPWP